MVKFRKGIYTVVTKDAIAIVREILLNDLTHISDFQYRKIMHNLDEDIPVVLEHSNFGDNIMDFFAYFYQEVNMPLMTYAEVCVYDFSVYVSSPEDYLHILNERSSHE